MSFWANTRTAWIPFLALLSACSPLDTMGAGEQVTETLQQARSDDLLSDKHPTYDEALTVTEDFETCEVTLNKSASVTRLTLEALSGNDAALAGQLFPTRAAALAALSGRTLIPSMEMINGALKPFNDGLYATVELLAETGQDGVLINKRALFDGILTELVSRAEGSSAARTAAAQFAAAYQLGTGNLPSVASDIAATASSLLARFDGTPLLSKPLGFYTWLPELERTYRRDRFLMYAAPVDAEVTEVVGALLTNGSLQQSYRDMLGLYAGLTNPFRDYSPIDVVDSAAASTSSADPATVMAAFLAQHPNLRQPCNGSLSWLPPSVSPETALFDRMACDGKLSGNLLDALIAAIQAGTIDLTPTASSGWYDRQIFALETLLVPARATENDHLLLTREYKEKLIETFKSLIVQTRETHVKQLAESMASSAPAPEIDLYPLLPVEPFPTFYLRTARAYAFVETLLKSSIGTAALEASSRVLEDGTRATQSMAAELAEKTRLMYGLHLVAAASIGMRDEVSDAERASVDLSVAESEARAWLRSIRDNVDVLRDPRVLVPIASDLVATTYWGVVGVKVLRMHASYPDGFVPQVVSSGFCKIRGWVAFEPYMLVEQTLEVRRSHAAGPLNRDEFRALCDERRDLESIRAALESE